QNGRNRPSPPTAKMAAYEKRRAAAAPAPAPTAGSGLAEPVRTAVKAGGLENEAEFLLEAGVTAMVREALLKVLEARPEEPVSFLADYFERLVLSSPGAAGEASAELPGPPQRLARALWYVRLAHHSHRTAFDGNTGAAYEVLGAGGRRRKAGVDGRLYSEVCRAVLRALEDALGAGHFSLPGRYLEAGSKLGPDGLALAMDRALQERKLSTAMSREEFLKKATALFVAKVKPVE
ncbi:TPGS1 polyglutamylase, partial [Rhynochetos jubatus]|nr:TPGS1 polyglutamylase [Rhynochetos jubatus]